MTLKLDQLKALRQGFVIRAERLAADVAMVGLIDDLLDAAHSAVELSRSGALSSAFPQTRTVFEAAQRVIAVATDDDYLRVGTRAWLYYHRKDKRIVHFARGPEAAKEWFVLHYLQAFFTYRSRM